MESARQGPACPAADRIRRVAERPGDEGFAAKWAQSFRPATPTDARGQPARGRVVSTLSANAQARSAPEMKSRPGGSRTARYDVTVLREIYLGKPPGCGRSSPALVAGSPPRSGYSSKCVRVLARAGRFRALVRPAAPCTPGIR